MPSQRVHSRYERVLNDLPWQGRPVALRLQARRFRCLAPFCPRQTFSEHLADVATVAARRTERLGDLQRHLGLALGGEAGARLAERLAMRTGPPGFAGAIAVAKRLNGLLRRKSEESLDGVLDDAAGMPLAEFAASLRRDGLAVQAALDLPWTTRPAEGQINRLKMLKRTMSGRAGFQLLRARVLHAA